MLKKHQNPEDVIGFLNASMLPESAKKLLSRSDLLMSVRHDKVIIYKGRDSAAHGRKRDPLSDLNLKKRKYNGSLSKSSIKHVSKQVSLWADSIENFNRYYRKPLNMRKRNLVFFTVTLPSPQIHKDQEIKRKIFVPFLDAMRYNHGTMHYFWRAEAQKNGNIHFHIFFDKYIPVKQVQKLWNQTLEKLGYISEFEKKFNHRNPPTTNAKVVDGSKYTIKYLLKYATKDSEARNITGKIWGMSTSIRCLKVQASVFDKSLIATFERGLSKKECTMFENEHYVSFTYKKPVFLLTNENSITGVYRDRLFKIYSYLYFDDCPFDEDISMLIYQGLDLDELSSITRQVVSINTYETVGDISKSN